MNNGSIQETSSSLGGKEKTTIISPYKLTGSLMLAILVGMLIAVLPQRAQAGSSDSEISASQIFPPDAEAYGKTLQEWLTIYWAWNFGGADPAQSVVDGVQLMPIPNGDVIGGSFTPEDPLILKGRLEITLPPDTPFVLPAFGWIGERYEGYPEVPDDPTVEDDVLLAGVHPNFTLDGIPILTDENKADYYIPPTYFDPIVEYAEPTDYGSVAAVYFQGSGFVSAPLSEGQHILHLYESYIIPAGAYEPLPEGFGVIYDNTWIVTVESQASPKSKRNPNPGIARPNSNPHGHSYGEWAAAWWQWVVSIPADQNPNIDTTGDLCGVGQSGPVWFLPGTFDFENVVERHCEVPAGKALFFPIYNWLFGAGIFDCEPTVPGVECDVPALQEAAASQTVLADILDVTIDGALVQNVRDYRAFTEEPFPIIHPEDSVFGVDAGIYFPQVADGYWLMLNPLSKGEHTIRVHVRAPDTLFGTLEFEFINHLTVK